MPLLLSLIVIISISYVFTRLSNRLHFSSVIGLIVAGLILAVPPIRSLVVAGHKEVFGGLADIGLVTLMFLAGFEVSWNMIVKERRGALVITLFTVATSLFLGFVVFTLLGFKISTALIMGICFGITAESVKARVLLQMGKIRTRLGSLLMGTGIINDIIGVFLLILVAYFFTDNNISMKEVWLLGGMLAAFFIGILVHCLFNRENRHLKRLENILLATVVPFLFVNIGLNFNLSSFSVDIPILVLVIVTATVGQIFGVFLTRPITKLSWRQLWLVGWGMNAKGAVELAIAYIALTVGILPTNLYSALVVTTLVTTTMFQVVIFRMVKKYPGIMN
ncbi:MAG: cation:proton antiporter [Candidatus Falkowbacteria bacterium]